MPTQQHDTRGVSSGPRSSQRGSKKRKKKQHIAWSATRLNQPPSGQDLPGWSLSWQDVKEPWGGTCLFFSECHFFHLAILDKRGWLRTTPTCRVSPMPVRSRVGVLHVFIEQSSLGITTILTVSQRPTAARLDPTSITENVPRDIWIFFNFFFTHFPSGFSIVRIISEA